MEFVAWAPLTTQKSKAMSTRATTKFRTKPLIKNEPRMNQTTAVVLNR